MSEVAVSHVRKRFGDFTALDDVSIRFDDGGFYGLLGPSGSGKTTLLRVVAGFIFADSGSVTIGGEAVDQVPVERRDVGMVFQSYALFPNMSVAENVGFGLRVRRVSDAERDRRVAEALELVQLGDLAARRPHQLSGGQRQRVALARAIAPKPRVLLLDEPLSALDKALRVDMQVELKRIQREVGVTTIFVTHDQEEALTLSDRIGILRAGRLVQEGPPEEVYRAPVDSFAARFLGDANILSGAREKGGLRLADGTLIALAAGAPAASSCAVRTEVMRLAPPDAQAAEGENSLQAVVAERIFAGPTTTYLLEWRGQTLKLVAASNAAFKASVGDRVALLWPREETAPLAE